MSPSAAARLRQAFAAAVADADPRRRVSAALADPAVTTALGGRPVWLLAVGKAAAAMAAGAAGLPVVERLVVTPADAGHPVPDERSVAAGAAALAMVRRVPPDGALLALISGGASALLALPIAGLTLAAKVARVEALRAQGAAIGEVNALRTALSQLKGGGLARACAGAVVTLVCSDVVGDDPRVIGSGPTVGRTGDVVRVIAPLATVAHAMAAALGVAAAPAPLQGDVAVVAAVVAATPGAMVWAAEPTLVLPPAPPPGGRATHLALLLARAGAGQPGWCALVAGTDGVDGTPPAEGEAPVAGAIVDGTTWAAAGAPIDDLQRHAARAALARAGVLLQPGATGINHADVIALLRG